MVRRRRLGLRRLPVVAAGVALLGVGCSGGGLRADSKPAPIDVQPNDSPVVAGAEHFLVSTGEPGRPTHLVRVGREGQVDFPEDGGLISGTQLEDGSWFILNSSCQGAAGVCGNVGGLTIANDGEVVATGDLWDVPGTYDVVGSSGSMALVGARTDTETTAWWVDTTDVTAETYAYRSAPYDSVAIRDAAEATGGTKEFDTPRFRFCASESWAYTLASPSHLGAAEPPSRVVEVAPSPANAAGAPRLFTVDVDGFDARLAGALMCDDERLSSVSVGPGPGGGSEIARSAMDLVTGEATTTSVADYGTPLVDLYGGGKDRALISVSDLGDVETDGESSPAGDETPGSTREEPPAELLLVTDDGELAEIGPQAPTGPAVLSLNGRVVLQPDGDTVSVTVVEE